MELILLIRSFIFTIHLYVCGGLGGSGHLYGFLILTSIMKTILNESFNYGSPHC